MTCGRQSPDTQFAKYTSGPCKGKDRPHCKECWVEYRRQNHANNLTGEKIEANKKKCAEYYLAHRNEQNVKSRSRYANKYSATRNVSAKSILAKYWQESNDANKVCSQCGKNLLIRKHFYVRVKLGQISIRENCKKCHTTMTLQKRSLKPAGSIWSRYKKSAKKREFEFSITKQDVERAIGKPCSYCGEDSILMTLDRVENTIGYAPSNVVPCCIRCNIMKADMPKEAWLKLAPHVKTVRESGLFGNWIGRMGFATKLQARS